MRVKLHRIGGHCKFSLMPLKFVKEKLPQYFLPKIEGAVIKSLTLLFVKYQVFKSIFELTPQ